MLDATSEQTITFKGVFSTVQILIGYKDALRAGNICIDSGKGKASFFVVISSLGNALTTGFAMDIGIISEGERGLPSKIQAIG